MAENDNTEVALLLLEKKKRKRKYYDNCPGCKIEQLKQTSPYVPSKLFFLVWIIVLGAGASSSPSPSPSPSPLFYFFYFSHINMIKHTEEQDFVCFIGRLGSSSNLHLYEQTDGQIHSAIFDSSCSKTL